MKSSLETEEAMNYPENLKTKQNNFMIKNLDEMNDEDENYEVDVREQSNHSNL